MSWLHRDTEHPNAADAWLAQLATLDADVALLHRAYFATLPTLRSDSARLDSLGTALRRSTSVTRRVMPQSGAIHAFATLPSIFPELNHYLQGRVAARLGRWPEVEEAENRLRALDGPPRARALAADFALSLAALRALARGDSALAVTLLGRAKIETLVELLNSSWFYSQSAEQFQRAELARWRGRQDVALQTYAAAQHSRIFAAPAAFAMAKIHEQSGNRPAGIREYRRVLHLRAGAEPIEQPLADQARQRLAALGFRSTTP